MYEKTRELLEVCWSLTTVLAPFLLLGFACLALFDSLIPENWVRRHLQGKGILPILKAIAVGVPLPLCSCSVIPVTAGLKARGASKGAVTTFVTTTPQTGVDSILVSYGTLGGILTLVRVVISCVSGFLAGLLIMLLDKKTEETVATSPKVIEEKSTFRFNLKEGCYNGFIKAPADIGLNLLLGIFLAGLLTVFVPFESWNISDNFLLALIVSTCISIPLYVCATASIPLALGMITSGFPLGAALIMLTVGPATNVVTLTALLKILGKKETLYYVFAIVVVSWTAAFLVETFLSGIEIPQMASMAEGGQSAFNILSAIVLLVIIFASKFIERSRQLNQNHACHNP